jgi:hypothetical protein
MGQSEFAAHCPQVCVVGLQMRGPVVPQSFDCRHCTQVPVELSQKRPALEPAQLLLPWHCTHWPVRALQYGFGAAHSPSDLQTAHVWVA